MKRYAGLLASEWVTAGIVVVVGAAVAWGMVVGNQREVMVDNAKATIEAVRDAVAAAAESETMLACDNTIVDEGVLSNDYLSFSIGTLPIYAQDEETRYGAAIFLQTEKAVDSNDTFQTVKALHKTLEDDEVFTLKTTEHDEDEIAFAVFLSEYPVCEGAQVAAPQGPAPEAAAAAP